MMPPVASRLLIWDRQGPAPRGDWTPILWRSFAAPGDEGVSIPRHLEDRADVLRGRYLAWVHDLGRELVDGKSIVDRLEFRPGFSFWWMSLLVEKSNAFNSTQIINAVKLFALEDWSGGDWRGEVILESTDAPLAAALRGWCRNAGLQFQWRRGASPQQQPPTQTPSPSLARRVLRRLPLSAQALVMLVRHLALRGALRGTGAAELAATPAEITFCSYLFNLDKRAAASGRFASSFWTDLHGLLELESVDANWLLLIIEHEFVRDAARGRELINEFNQHAAGRRAHVPLEGLLGWRLALRALRDYLRVSAAARSLAARVMFRPRASALDLWPLFERDWNDSLMGAAAMSGCIFFNLFEETLRRLPRQRLGFYLQENIGWERAFVHCWKAAGHGCLVGVPHSTVRYWDLRYFSDPRDYERRGSNDLPLPDLVALNGPAARDVFINGGYPPPRIVEVEALRYLHLATPAVPVARASAPLRVLVLGDYVSASTRQQMRWLAGAASLLPVDTRYTVKPHPACPINTEDYPTIELRLTDARLDQLLGDCDVAYTSNMTSAAVDAYSFGVPVVSVLDGEAFNISPLRGNTDAVKYVTNADELAQALASARHPGAANQRDYFHLDKKLPRWRQLLGLQKAS